MKTILVIDDDSFSRAILKLVLEEAGYRVQSAIHGREGLDMYRRTPADLVIVDIFMPEKDGLETIFALKERYPDVKTLAISGGGVYCDLDCLDIARRFGADACLVKPFRRADVIASVETCLFSSVA